MFTSLGVLVQLGLSGVGEPTGLIGQLDSLIRLPRSNGIGVVGMGVNWARRVFVSIHNLSQFSLTDAPPKAGPSSTCHTIRPSSFRINDLSSAFRIGSSHFRAVCTPFIPLCAVIAYPDPCRIGNLLGEQKAKRAGMAAKTSIIMALLLSMISRHAVRAFAFSQLLTTPLSSSSSAMFLIFRNVWGYLFNDDPGLN